MERNQNLGNYVPPRLNSDNKSSINISLTRPALTQRSFEKNYAYQKPKDKGFCESAKDVLAYEFSSARIKRGLRARLPFLESLQNYSQTQAIGDLVAGLTVGIMQIPLGMAYAVLGNCPAVTGLYTSFFPVLLYFFFGPSRHNSQGTFAITSLMFGKTVARLASPTSLSSAKTSQIINATIANHTILRNHTAAEGLASSTGYSAIEVAAAVCLLVGIVQVILGFIRFGYLSIYLSDSLISGFTTGAAVLVFTSQFASLFSIKVPPNTSSLPSIFWTYKCVFENMGSAIPATVIISVVALIVLTFTAEVVNPKVIQKIKVPIPMELIVVIIGTGISYGMNLNSNYKVEIVGNIDEGIEAPKVPPIFSLFSDIYGDVIAIGIVTYLISFSLAKIFATKYKYDVNANQEAIAMGISNFVSSFFNCFPMCVALSRSMVLEGAGGSTQMAGLISCGIVLVVILWLAYLFENLPNCILAAIIIVAIRRMFLQFRDLKRAWYISKLEALTWLVTFLAVCFISIDIGLGIGVVFSLLTIVFRAQWPYVTTMGKVKDADVYVDNKKFPQAEEEPGIKIYHFGSPLLFANSKSFRKQLYQVTEVNPRIITKKMQKLQKKKETVTKKLEKEKSNIMIINMDTSTTNRFESNESQKDKNQNMNGIGNPAFETDADSKSDQLDSKAVESSSILDEMNQRNTDSMMVSLDPGAVVCDNDDDGESTVTMSSQQSEHHMVLSYQDRIESLKKGLYHIIIDGSSVSFIDFSGITVLQQVVDEYKSIGIKVYLAGFPGNVLDMFAASGLYDTVPQHLIYPTIRDAVIFALNPQLQELAMSSPSTEV